MTDFDGKRIALERIAEEAEAKTGILDLGGLGLTEFPEELWELQHVHTLYLGLDRELSEELWNMPPDYPHNNFGTALSQLCHLPALTALWLVLARIDNLSPLEGLTQLQSLNCMQTKVSDLSPLAGLTALQELDCSGTQASDLSPLQDLTALQSLNCSGTQVSDLSPLRYLRALQTLNCSGTKVSDLSPLKNLRALQTLNCLSTQVADLSALTDLTTLQELNCSNTPVSDLSPLKDLTALQTLYFSSTAISDLFPLKDLKALQTLSCVNTGVSDLLPLQGVTALQLLDCWNTQVSDLAPLKHLTALQSLNCWNTQVSDLTPLRSLTALLTLNFSNTEVSDLAPLEGLTALQSLDFWNTQVSDLSPLRGLTALEALDCAETQISDLSQLNSLTALQSLLCWNTRVSDLSPLEGLTGLQVLACSGTQVADLSPLKGLRALEILNCNNCNLSDTPLDFWLALPGGCNLYLYDTQVTGVDAAALSQDESDDCLERLRADILDRREGSEAVTTVKLLVLGNGRSGKTQMTRRLEKLHFEAGWDSTHGIRLTFAELAMTAGEPPARLNIWDFGGQDIYHGTHALFLRSRAIFALVWCEERNNAEIYEHQGISFRNHPLPYWAHYVRHLAGTDNPLLTVQTHCDSATEEKRLPLSNAELDGFAFHRNLHFGAEKPRGLPVLQAVLGEAIEHLRETQGVAEIGKGRAAVRRRIEALRDGKGEVAREHKLMDRDTFDAWCAEAGNISSTEALLEYFHNSGLIFYRKDQFNGRIIIDQAWAMNAIYAVFDRTRSYPQLLAEGGRFTRPRLEQLVWVHEGFSPDDQRVFIQMMQQCGMCFVYRGDRHHQDDDTVYIAPDLLPPREKVQGDIDARWDFDAPTHELPYDYPLLHEGLMRSLLSRIGQSAGMDALYWRGGVTAYEGKTRSRLLLESEPHEKGWGGLVKLQTRGPGAEELAGMMIEWIEEENARLGLKPIYKGSKPRESYARDSRGMKKPAGDSISAKAPETESASTPAPEPVFAPDPKDEFDYCVSYAWGDDKSAAGKQREVQVDEFCAEAAKRGKRVLRDKRELGLGDSIIKFMDRLSKGKCVLVFLSEKYLRSPYCTYELSEVWRRCGQDKEELNRRVRLYFIPDAADSSKAEVNISSMPLRMKWFDFWQEQYSELNEIADSLAKRGKIASLPPNDHTKLRVMKSFADNVLEILGAFADSVQPRTWEDFLNYSFDEDKDDD